MGNLAQKTVRIPRNTKMASFFNVKRLGFEPRAVFDVGAQIGTYELYQNFPMATHILIETVLKNEPYLKKICDKLADAHLYIAAASSKSGTVNMKISENFKYSSICSEEENFSALFFDRLVRAFSLDDVCRERNLKGPFLVKIDVDGKEIEVLKGATETLKNTEFLITEATLFGQIYDVIDFMRNEGFVAYDIVDLMYRPIDNALWQVDLAFVKENGLFRKMCSFGTPEQEKLLSTQ